MFVKKLHVTSSQYAALFYLILVLILFFSDKGKITGDGIVRWNTLKTLMEEHRLTPDKYTIVHPLLAAPLYLIGDIRVKITGMFSPHHDFSEDERIQSIKKATQRFNKFVVLAIAIWVYVLYQNMFGFTPKQATAGVIFLLFGSFLIPHAKDFYTEPLWTCFSLIALSLLSTIWGQSLKAIDVGTLLFFSLMITLLIPLNPALLIVFIALAGLITGYRIVAKQPSFKADVSGILLSVGFGSALCFLENGIRRADSLNFGYGSEGFTTPLLHGLLGQLVSPTRGIIFFIPAFFCGFILLIFHWKTSPSPQTIFINSTLLYSILLLLTYAKWHTWHGAWYWGPRFLLPLSVFGAVYFVLLVKKRWGYAKRIMKTMLISIGILSFLIYKVGVAINQKHLIACLEQYPHSEQCFWDIRLLPYSALINPQDVVKLVPHRSTVVELIGLILIGLLLKYSLITPPTPNSLLRTRNPS